MITVGIPVRNQLEYVRKTINSVLNYGTLSTRLIIIDDASDTKTSGWLKSLNNLQCDFKLIHNKYREGFAFNVNLILDESKGNVIILLNSDTVVTRGWDLKLSHALAAPDAGLAGPSTSCTHTPQVLLECRFGRFDISDEEIRARGEKISRKYKGKKEHLNHLGGFCFAISRNAFNKAGYFDERFGFGPFEENDYADRVIKKGLKVEWIKDAYVHHFGGRSFNEEGATIYKALKEKSEKFYNTKRNGEIEHEWVRRKGEGKLTEFAKPLEW